MARHFNTAGPCLVEDHYMLSPAARLGQIRGLVDSKKFFVIHAPRQTGKTTLLRNLSRELTAEGAYAAITVSLENFLGIDVDKVIPQIFHGIAFDAKYALPKNLQPPKPEDFSHAPDTAFKNYLGAWAASIDKPLVIFIDEIDAIPRPLLISILRQLRNGYTSRPSPFPQSVALVGLKDVRDYKILDQVRGEEKSLGTASPFNIKDESFTLRNFNEAEVRELLEQHTTETGQVFEDAAIAEIFNQTQGQPWLTNALASLLTTHYDALVPDRSMLVTADKVMEAREVLIKRRDTHLDSLVDKLRDERVKRIIQPILIGDNNFDETFNDDFSYVKDLGLVDKIKGRLDIANPIYREIIPRVLSFQVQMGIDAEPAWYVAEDGTLDMQKLIKGFLKFWTRNGEILLKGMAYHEAAPHLTFMAYLQRITNGNGMIHREFAIGTGRADLVVDFGGRKDVIELKLQRGKWTVPEGLEQVARYAKKLGRNTAYLIVFDPTSKTPFEDRGQIEELTQDQVKVVLIKA